MSFLGIEYQVGNVPELDEGFIPLEKWNAAFLKTATKPFAIAVERTEGLCALFETKIHGDAEHADADYYYVERMVKTLLWMKGGFRVHICGDDALAEKIKQAYSPSGVRAFDHDFVHRVYERDLEIVSCSYDNRPKENETSSPMGRHMDGCRIGFDAGGSDRKVSAVIDGESVFSEEVVWLPKENTDPQYHFDGIVDSLKRAASKMPRVDGIGVSSAGVYIDNRTAIASLFIKVPQDAFDAHVRDIYIRAAKEIGDVPLVVCNDGDVTALAGAMSMDANNVLGIAMGTSEAAGYVDAKGNITGWLNELAFVPVDANADAMEDEWSGDIGCGVKYFSQDGVIKLAPRAGIELDESATPAEKLKAVQTLMEADDPRAVKVYDSIGVYLGHALAWYNSLYRGIGHVLLLGRVMSGKGGDIILDKAKKVLAAEYPEVTLKAEVPDEKARRVGQSVAAASLPDIK